MLQLIVKYAVTAFVIVVVSEIARRAERLGALIAALPFVTIMVMIWLYLEHAPKEKITAHAFYTFWYVLPTLPMFLLFPWLYGKLDIGFWPSLGWCAALTMACFALTALLGAKFGLKLW